MEPDWWGAAVSVSEKGALMESGPPVRAKEKDCGSPEGIVTSSTMIWPRLVCVKVQVTTSPAEIEIEAALEPSLQTTEVRSHPAGSGDCEAAYVPGLIETEEYGLAASVSEKDAARASGPPESE